MTIAALIILAAAALLFLIGGEGRDAKWLSHGLFVLTVGVILAFLDLAGPIFR